MHIKEACEYPIRCFSASVINSLKGGKFISKEQNGFVLDIGGTSTDIAIL